MNKCLVCTSSNTRFLYKVREYNIRRCGDCAVGFISPLPDRDAIKKIYENVHGSGDYTAGHLVPVNFGDIMLVAARKNRL